MSRPVVMSFAASLTYLPPHPERTARKSLPGIGGDTVYRTWTSRAAMARTIRMQQQRAPRNDDWHACVRLSDTEGY